MNLKEYFKTWLPTAEQRKLDSFLTNVQQCSISAPSSNGFKWNLSCLCMLQLPAIHVIYIWYILKLYKLKICNRRIVYRAFPSTLFSCRHSLYTCTPVLCTTTRPRGTDPLMTVQWTLMSILMSLGQLRNKLLCYTTEILKFLG